MSLADLRPSVPCTICGKMVPLGPLGDTGNKKCQSCKYQLSYAKRKKQSRLRTATCVRCGKEYSGTARQICSLCQEIVRDLYHNIHERECIYCGKPTGRNDFCSRTHMSNVLNLVKRRKKKLDEVLKD